MEKKIIRRKIKTLKTEPLQIKGLNWHLSIQEDAQYDKVHGNESDGICIPADRHIYIRKSALNIETILHELGHAYYHSCLIYTADITVADVEEIFCEIISVHATEMVKISREIYKYMNQILSEGE